MDKSALMLYGIVAATIIGIILLIIGFNLKPTADGKPNSAKTPVMVIGVVFLLPVIIIGSMSARPGFFMMF